MLVAFDDGGGRGRVSPDKAVDIGVLGFVGAEKFEFLPLLTVFFFAGAAVGVCLGVDGLETFVGLDSFGVTFGREVGWLTVLFLEEDDEGLLAVLFGLEVGLLTDGDLDGLLRGAAGFEAGLEDEREGLEAPPPLLLR